MLTIKNYQVTAQIYESQNSVVYRGVRDVDKQPVILKLLHGEYPTPQQLTNYRQEYEMTRSIEATGVVKVYELVKYRNSLVMVLEDFGGQSLKSLRLAGTLSLEGFLHLAIQLSEILGQVHQAQIMHKDINLANVVMNPVTDVVKLIDFGISSRLSREYTTFRNANSLEGTLAYISPEQTGRMNRVVDYRTDLYSLGVTLYELLTGKLPFQETDPLALVHAHIAKTPLAPSHLMTSSHQMTIISDIIMKLLAKNAEDRYQSAFGLKYDLEQTLTLALSLWEREQNSPPPLPPFGGKGEGLGVRVKLGTRDFSGRFQIPQKLYGREKEIEILLQAFERVAGGPPSVPPKGGEGLLPLPQGEGWGEGHAASELLLIAGYSGVGKSALVHEVHKPITEKRGYFVSGKYDQFQRNVPYYAMTQALNEFCQLLLTETVASLADWKARILAAVGNNGQVLIEVIPNLGGIIGEQPNMPEVGPQESQNRFNLVFQNFMQAICQPEHPLVMFIDDLQWADSASLELLKQMLTDADNPHLLIIGAYRDNEVDAAHPFMLTLAALKKVGIIVQTITLPNLTVADVTALVADTLQSDSQAVSELVDLLYKKTQGNAFFITQFLTLLYEQEILRFDYTQLGGRQGWCWEVTQIQGLNLSDNVVELMADKLGRLNEETQAILKLAACIGNKFTISTLAVISEQTSAQALTAMWSAVEEGLILPLDENYRQILTTPPQPLPFEGEGVEMHGSVPLPDSQCKFLHDRVQQAAYSLIAKSDRAALHLQIGRLWLADIVRVQHLKPLHETVLFDIVNQLNAGRELMTAEAEKLRLVKLNLQASQKAKSAIAYQTALGYITIALDLLPVDSWTSHYQLTFNLMTAQAECQFLMGQVSEAEASFKLALAQAQTNLEKGQILSDLVLIYSNKLDFARWEEASSQGLQVLGLELPFHGEAVTVAVGQALAQIQTYLADKEIAEVLDLPEMTDEAKLKAMDLCIRMLSIAFVMGNMNLYTLLALKMVTLSLELGNSIFATHAYMVYGVILVTGFSDYRRGYEWGHLGLQLAKKYPTNAIHGKNYFVFATFMNHWRQPAKTSLDYYLQGYTQGIEVGDLTYAGYSGLNYIMHLLFLGANLEFIEQEMVKFWAFVQKTQDLVASNAFFSLISFILALTDQTHFQTTALNEAEIIENVRISNNKQGLSRYLINRLKADYILGQYGAAWRAAQEETAYIGLMMGAIPFAEFPFYHALTLLALWPTLAESERLAALETVTKNHALIKNWRENCSANFECMDLLLMAEVARLHGQGLESLELYEQAIASAKENEFMHLQALANELTAKFWLSLDKPHLAVVYLREAHYAYLQWGATAKVKQLESKYSELRVSQTSRYSSGTHTLMTTTTSQRTSSTGSQMLDLASVMKASQAISGEIKLASLLGKMMEIVVENAGAQRGLLILRQDNQWLLQASYELGVMSDELKSTPNSVRVLQAVPVESIGGQSDNPKLSGAMLRYVERTQRALVLNDARREGQFTQTDYVRKCQPKAILCVPLVNQGVVMGFIYLENNLSTHAFTPERVEVVQLLGTQATISLNNVQTITLQAEQEKLRIENEMLGKLNADKDKFFSIVAHDLKGPFLPLLGNLELMTEMTQTLIPQDVHDMSAAAHRSARRVYELLDNLLHWARLQMGRMEYQPESLVLQDVAQQPVEVLSEVAESKGIRLLNEVAPEVMVYGDGNMLNTVIRNLVNNALKFTSPGGRVTISSEELGVRNEESGVLIPNSQLLTPHYIVVSIADTGVGMDEATRQKLFKLDQHVTTVGTGKETGTGLGLIICQEMVIQGGGRIWVESELGKGTTVKFTVRRAVS